MNCNRVLSQHCHHRHRARVHGVHRVHSVQDNIYNLNNSSNHIARRGLKVAQHSYVPQAWPHNIFFTFIILGGSPNRRRLVRMNKDGLKIQNRTNSGSGSGSGAKRALLGSIYRLLLSQQQLLSRLILVSHLAWVMWRPYCSSKSFLPRHSQLSGLAVIDASISWEWFAWTLLSRFFLVKFLPHRTAAKWRSKFQIECQSITINLKKSTRNIERL